MIEGLGIMIDPEPTDTKIAEVIIIRGETCVWLLMTLIVTPAPTQLY